MSGLAPSSSPRRILLCGYYGEHNLGDDALLEVLNRQLPKGWQPVITANSASAVQKNRSEWNGGEQKVVENGTENHQTCTGGGAWRRKLAPRQHKFSKPCLLHYFDSSGTS
jgi:hypothetical protein